jgi:hypothetical protein
VKRIVTILLVLPILTLLVLDDANEEDIILACDKDVSTSGGGCIDIVEMVDNAVTTIL